jgi:hypothetical protein
MQSFHENRFYSFRVDANALGGYLEEPFPKNIPSVAGVSLPAVGGIASARSGAVHFDEIVSCESAYTRVSGMVHPKDGSVSILSSAVAENVNILDVLTARRIVAQVSIYIAGGSKEPRLSFAGSGFEGLRLAGRHRQPAFNSTLMPKDSTVGDLLLPVSWQDVAKEGRVQVERLLDRFKGNKDAEPWAQGRHSSVTFAQPPDKGGMLLGSLVDGFEGDDPEQPAGHIVEIPGFGRIFLCELRVTRDSVQLVAVRAQLGCPVKGGISVNAVGGGGSGEN